ncbi:MAG: hypothetical protein MHM6MM_005458 [Cercozoa sp. M6MM]
MLNFAARPPRKDPVTYVYESQSADRVGEFFPKELRAASPGQQPVSPAQALQRFRHLLTPHEESEILSYKTIYFLGATHTRKVNGLRQAPNNGGFDDPHGDYIVRTADHLAYRYEILKVIGKGAFGRVVLVRDHATEDFVAVKIIRNRKRFSKQSEVERRVLNHCMSDGAPFIVQLKQAFEFRNHCCLVFEKLGDNLYEHLKANKFAGFGEQQVRNITCQLVRALVFCRRHKIIHCDVKPENVLIDTSKPRTLQQLGFFDVKLIDFGSSCYESERLFT